MGSAQSSSVAGNERKAELNSWLTRDNGSYYLFGIPLGRPWNATPEALLRSFEPENPAILVPRTFGVGWDLNLGAIAAKLRLIRPDDSLPDLEPYFPEKTRKTLFIAPWGFVALNTLFSINISKAKIAAMKWSLSGKPQKYYSGRQAAVMISALSVCSAVAPPVVGYMQQRSRSSLSKISTPRSAVDVVTTAYALGIQCVALITAAAAQKEMSQRGHRQLITLSIPFIFPVISGGVLVAVVKKALAEVNRSLIAERTREEKNNERN